MSKKKIITDVENMNHQQRDQRLIRQTIEIDAIKDKHRADIDSFKNQLLHQKNLLNNMASKQDTQAKQIAELYEIIVELENAKQNTGGKAILF